MYRLLFHVIYSAFDLADNMTDYHECKLFLLIVIGLMKNCVFFLNRLCIIYIICMLHVDLSSWRRDPLRLLAAWCKRSINLVLLSLGLIYVL